MRKGQFLMISAVVGGLVMITLSSSINEITSNSFERTQLPKHINLLRDEAERITADGTVTPEEERNFRKMTDYIESYRTSVEIKGNSNPCVKMELVSTHRTVEMPCIS